MDSTHDYASWSDLPVAAKNLFLLAAEHWDDNTLSQSFVEQALQQFDSELEVLVSAYRYYFYKSRPGRALLLADQILERVRQIAELPQDWEDQQPILVAGKEDPMIRLYLAAYASQGLLLAQLGKQEEAKLISSRVKALDDRRQYCASTVFDVLTASPDDE